MEMTTYYGMDKNPFTKDATVSTLYASNDFNQMTNRLDHTFKGYWCIFKQSRNGKDDMFKKDT